MKIFTRIVVFFLATLLPLTAEAYDFMVGDLCYNINSDGTSVTVTYENNTSQSYSSLSGDLIIPDSVTNDGTTYSVSTIGNWAFYGCSGLVSVAVANSVSSIGNSAFGECRGLTSVDFGRSVKSIGNYAFYRCSGLTVISIPDNVSKIGGSAFSECTSLAEVYIGKNGSIDFSTSIFYGCNNISIIQIFYSNGK